MACSLSVRPFQHKCCDPFLIPTMHQGMTATKGHTFEACNAELVSTKAKGGRWPPLVMNANA
jgi:hypothetical protein